MKKQFLALSFIALTGINAENKPPMEMQNEQIRPSCTECYCDPCSCHTTCNCYTPFSCIPEGIDFFVNADFIYWRAQQEKVQFAISGLNTPDRAEPIGKGKVFQPDFSWNPGFKVGLGWIFCDCFDLSAEYIWYRSHGNSNAVNAASEKSFIIPGNSEEFFPIFSVKGRWDLDFDVIDIELGRNFGIIRCLQLRPFIGCKGAWQEQKFTVKIIKLNESNHPSLITQIQDQENWGIGIRAGCDTTWNFSPCLSVYGNIALSNIWTDFDTHRIDNTKNLVTNEVIPNIDTDFDFESMDAIIELELGIRWETTYCGCLYLLQAGWESQVWINHGQMLNLPTEGGVYNGDLSLYGLSVKAKFGF